MPFFGLWRFEGGLIVEHSYGAPGIARSVQGCGGQADLLPIGLRALHERAAERGEHRAGNGYECLQRPGHGSLMRPRERDSGPAPTKSAVRPSAASPEGPAPMGLAKLM